MKEKRPNEVHCWLWDVIERSRGGHERRRRLLWRMTEGEARQWEATHDAKLRKVEESMLQADGAARARARARRV